MINSVSKQLKGTATMEHAAYRGTFGSYVKREVSDVFDPSLPDINEPVAPERSLLLAMIHLSILDVISPGPQAKPGRVLCSKLSHSRRVALRDWQENRDQAMKWLLHEHDVRAVYMMSLDWCCRGLGVLASDIRKRVKVTLGLISDPMVQPYTRASLCL